MKLKAFYGLPEKVIFCKKTLISNQLPSSTPEFTHTIKSKKKTTFIDKNFISDPWKYSRLKKKIDFKKREKELLKLLVPLSICCNSRSSILSATAAAISGSQ
jgi:hypothetical protein